MANPRLKAGDTLTYTKKMSDAKQKSAWGGGAEELIGQIITVKESRKDNIGRPVYEMETDRGHLFEIHVIDDHLPPAVGIGKNRHARTPFGFFEKRRWKKNLTVKSDDGIEVTQKEIKVLYPKDDSGHFVLPVEEAKALYKELRSALAIHKKHFK